MTSGAASEVTVLRLVRMSPNSFRTTSTLTPRLRAQAPQTGRLVAHERHAQALREHRGVEGLAGRLGQMRAQSLLRAVVDARDAETEKLEGHGN